MPFIVVVDNTRRAKVHKTECASLKQLRTSTKNGYRKEIADRQKVFKHVYEYDAPNWDTGACGMCNP